MIDSYFWSNHVIHFFAAKKNRINHFFSGPKVNFEIRPQVNTRKPVSGHDDAERGLSCPRFDAEAGSSSKGVTPVTRTLECPRNDLGTTSFAKPMRIALLPRCLGDPAPAGSNVIAIGYSPFAIRKPSRGAEPKKPLGGFVGCMWS
jgi:hypothetical protein